MIQNQIYLTRLLKVAKQCLSLRALNNFLKRKISTNTRHKHHDRRGDDRTQAQNNKWDTHHPLTSLRELVWAFSDLRKVKKKIFPIKSDDQTS